MNIKYIWEVLVGRMKDPKFVVGDRVRLVGLPEEDSQYNGLVGTVTDVDQDMRREAVYTVSGISLRCLGKVLTKVA